MLSFIVRDKPSNLSQYSMIEDSLKSLFLFQIMVHLEIWGSKHL